MASKRIGIDTGGTFTDLILFDVDDGTISSLKVSSTPKEPLRAFISVSPDLIITFHCHQLYGRSPTRFIQAGAPRRE